jgi:hypothetical protein
MNEEISQQSLSSSNLLSFLQNTVTRDGKEVSLRGKGRHDPCVLPRAVPMVEAMVALTLVDALMTQHAQCELFPNEMDAINPMGKTAHRREGAPVHAGVPDGEPVQAVSQRIDEE